MTLLSFPHLPLLLIPALWMLFAASWMLASKWSAGTAQRAPASEVLPYRALQVLGFTLFAASGALGAHFRLPYWRTPEGAQWALAGGVLLGFCFAWWARLHLGRLWSSSVERKEEHRVIDTGPYALVRHPIYTGVLLSLFASAIAMGFPLALLGAIFAMAGFWVKARLEEKFLRDQLGPDAYDAYARGRPMLVPFL